MSFFVNKLGPMPTNRTSNLTSDTAPEDPRSATFAPAVAVARATAQVKAQEAQGGAKAPQSPPAPAPEPEKKKKGWF